MKKIEKEILPNKFLRKIIFFTSKNEMNLFKKPKTKYAQISIYFSFSFNDFK